MLACVHAVQKGADCDVMNTNIVHGMLARSRLHACGPSPTQDRDVTCACRAQVVSRDIRNVLTQRALYFNIVLDDVSITNLTFSREYTGAVEAKQVAQQESERAKFLVRPPRPLARAHVAQPCCLDPMGHSIAARLLHQHESATDTSV